MISRRLRCVSVVVCLLAAFAGVVLAAETRPDAKLAGTVLKPDGTAAAGANVLLLARVTGDDEPIVREVATDAAGRFEAPVAAGAHALVRVAAPGFAVAFVKEAAPDKPVDVRLAPGGSIEGAVYDRDAVRPLAEAEVLALPPHWGMSDPALRARFAVRTRTDRDGRFRLKDLPFETLDVEVRAAGRQWTTQPVAATDPAARAPWFYVGPGGSVTGKVVGPDGAPVAGASVGVSPSDTSPRTQIRFLRLSLPEVRSAADGTFEVPGLPGGVSVNVQASHPKFARAKAGPVVTGSAKGAVVLKLAPGARVVGLLRVNGQPATGNVVLAIREHANRSARTQDATLADGRFAFEHLAAGEVPLEVRLVGFKSIKREKAVLRDGETVDLGTVDLEPAPVIAGRVVDRDGKPVEGAWVDARGFSMGKFGHGNAKTDADGRFRIGGLEEGLKYALAGNHDQKGTVRRADVALGDDVTLTLDPPGTLTGRVLSGDPPRPAPQFSVEIESIGGADDPFSMMERANTRVVPVRSAEGRFSIPDLAPGSWAATVNVPGCIPVRVDTLEIAAGGTADAGEVRAIRGVRVRVTVVDRKTKTPVADADVALEEPGLNAMMKRAMNIGSRQGRPTGPDGTVVLDGIAPGRVTISASHDAFAVAKKEIELDGKLPDADATIELGPGGAVEGSVRTKAGQVAAGFTVVLTTGMSVSDRSFTTVDESGHYRLDHLAPGTYMLIVTPQTEDQSAALAQMQMQSATVEDGRTTTIDFPTRSSSIVVKGTVRRGKTPIEARLFFVRGTTAASDLVTATSGADGSYEAKLAAPGSYQVRVQRATEEIGNPGFGVSIDVPDKPEVQQDIVQPEGALTGRALDADTGQPVAGARVTAIRVDAEGRQDDTDPLGGSAAAGDDGSYRLEGLRAGHYKVAAAARDRAIGIGPVFEMDGAKDAVQDVTLGRAVPVRVRVVGGDAATPVSGAIVNTRDGFLAMIGSLPNSTEADGVATLKTIGEGAHDLVAVAAGWAPAVRRGVAVDAARADQVVEIALQRGGAVRLHAVDGNGAPAANLGLRVRDTSGEDLTMLVLYQRLLGERGFLIHTDGAGALTVDALEAGEYELELVRDGKAVGRKKVRVVAGKTEDAKITVD